jgi:putative ABC transport system permease protein
MLDIPRDREAEFRGIVAKAAPAGEINAIPSLRGTVTEFGGQRVAELETLPEGAWVLRGDRGITYSAAKPEGSVLTAGQWWAKDYGGPPLVSVEEEVAATLGLGIGDTVSVNVLGVEVQARVASLRRVEWDNFGLNYVFVFSPGSFAAAPHNLIATLTVPPEAETSLARDLPRAFPSASLIAVRDVIGQVTTLLGQMGRAIGAAASIAILAGIAVLIGAIAASRERRMYDSVILKLLGATRRQILAAQALEYALLALVLAVLALGVGLLASRYVVVEIFEFAFAPDPLTVGLALFGGAGLAFVIGMVGSLPLLAARPAAALRGL